MSGTLNKLRTIANLIMICIAVERTFAAFKRDHQMQQALRRKSKRRS